MKISFSIFLKKDSIKFFLKGVLFYFWPKEKKTDITLINSTVIVLDKQFETKESMKKKNKSREIFCSKFDVKFLLKAELKNMEIIWL